MRSLALITHLCLLCALLSAAGVSAATLEFTPVADNTIYHDGSAGYNSTSDGSGPHLWSSVTAAGVIRRGLLRFDLGSVPRGSRVTSVQLILYESRSRSNHVVSLHRMLASWGEAGSNGGDAGIGAPAQTGDATWVHRFFPTTMWAQPGGDFQPVPSGSLNVLGAPAFYTWGSTQAMVNDVQAWLDAPASNHGWVLIGNEVVEQNAKRYSSRNSDQAAVRPKLVVNVDPPVTAADADVPLPIWAIGVLAALMIGGLGQRSLIARRASKLR